MEAMTAIITAVFAVFTEVAEWFVTAIPSVIALFYADGALTFIGVLALASLGVSVTFLLIGIIQRFLEFRG